eukprot:c9055_g1_i1.p2 GENE.c9055_g1_i1~~c9055_g1_i1.p2  ORF type:complete len:133 (+),score=22.67 c9055_g1_i1:51-449(+)
MSVVASHLLIKYQGSRRPASWKDPNGDQIRRRTKEQAAQILLALREEIVNAPNPSDKVRNPAPFLLTKIRQFAELATTNSDCSSAREGGSLGRFGRGEMQKPFEDAAFGLNVGEISGLIETESGVHIVLRVA